jgi:putative spermidine/putrescine transport system ATP-binding protein/mannopine transport system ATP-binding protein
LVDVDRVRGAAVSVEAVTKRYGSVVAVDGVSLAVRAGEFLALLGPSGSGKTTILMTIAGFEDPTAGCIRIDKRDVTDVPPNKRNIGMVFQKYALFPHMTVADNVAFPLKMRGISSSKRKARAEHALELVRLPGYGSRMPSQLSGGQQQRVAMARAIVYEPPVLLMDEPLGALDLKLRQQMQVELKHLSRELGTTVIYVTHDQGEALVMADRIAVLADGRLEQLGTPEELYERPLTPFVADFIGETNFLSGSLTWRNGRTAEVALAEGLTFRGTLPEVADDGTLTPGDVVQLAVRPERLNIQRAVEGAAGHLGVTIESIYAGNTVAVVVRLDAGPILTARMPTTADAAVVVEGTRVRVTWKPEDVRIYSGERR